MSEALIKRLLPHREPFLFLHSAEILSDGRGEGVARWPSSHPILAGHFPGLPIIPGVCQIEAAAQLAAVVALSKGEAKADSIGILGGVRRSLLHAPLFGDEDLVLEVKLHGAVGLMGLASGTGFRGGDKIITFELMLAVASRREIASAQLRGLGSNQ